MNKTETRLLNEMASDPWWVRSQIIHIWNSKRPHFGGDGPHRYAGNSQRCLYCNRPKRWKPQNVYFNKNGKETSR